MRLGTDELIVRLILAAVLGAIVGIERESAAKGAGARTHALVALGSAMFTIAGAYGFDDVNSGANVDPTRIAAQVATGVGFIGAGAILRHGLTVRGVTTASTVWLAASVGVVAAAGGWVAALAATVMALVILIVLQALKPVARRLGRRDATLELEYERGHGTLGPVLRLLKARDCRLQHVSIDDDDEIGSGGMRRVTLGLSVRRTDDLDDLLDELHRRPEVRAAHVQHYEPI